MKISAQPHATDPQPLTVSGGDPDTVYRFVFQDLGLQRITSIDVTTDASGGATLTPPLAFGLGAWKGTATPSGGDPIHFVNSLAADGSFDMTDPSAAANGKEPVEPVDPESQSAHAGSETPVYTPDR